MNRSDSYKDAVREAPPPRPPPPRRMASIDESGYAFNLVEYYLNERKNEYTSPRQVNSHNWISFYVIFSLNEFKF